MVVVHALPGPHKHKQLNHSALDDRPQHQSGQPDCFACVIVADPGLPALPFAQAARIPLAVAPDPVEPAALLANEIAWSPQRARAPPLGRFS